MKEVWTLACMVSDGDLCSVLVMVTLDGERFRRVHVGRGLQNSSGPCSHPCYLRTARAESAERHGISFSVYLCVEGPFVSFTVVGHFDCQVVARHAPTIQAAKYAILDGVNDAVPNLSLYWCCWIAVGLPVPTHATTIRIQRGFRTTLHTTSSRRSRTFSTSLRSSTGFRTVGRSSPARLCFDSEVCSARIEWIALQRLVHVEAALQAHSMRHRMFPTDFSPLFVN